MFYDINLWLWNAAECDHLWLQWEAFCVPELNNFLRVLDREQEEYLAQLRYKYKVMKRLILQRMKELRLETERQKRASHIDGDSTWNAHPTSTEIQRKTRIPHQQGFNVMEIWPQLII